MQETVDFLLEEQSPQEAQNLMTQRGKIALARTFEFKIDSDFGTSIFRHKRSLSQRSEVEICHIKKHASARVSRLR